MATDYPTSGSTRSLTAKRVVRKTLIGPKKVFDIEVRDVHNYYAGGMNVHNCEYHAMLQHAGARYDEELFKMGQTSVHYQHRNHLVYPSGPNKKTLRGKTRIFGAVDEMDFFNNDEDGEDQVKMNGVEVYKSLNNSLLTVRVGWKNAIKTGVFNIPNAYQFNISSPQSARGVLTETVTRNQDSRKVFCFHLATWEMNPMIRRSDLNQEYTDNYEKADRDFGANPPVADSPFISDPETVRRSFDEKRGNSVHYHFVHRKNKMGVTRRAAAIDKVMAPSNIPPSIMALDAGFSFNSFALTIGSVVKNPISKGRNIRISTMVEIIPEKNVATLDYSKIADLILYPLIEQLNVRAVFADRWNSLKLLHDIEARYEIPAEQYSIKYRDFTMVRSYLEDQSIILPRPETPIKNLDKILKPELSEYPRCFAQRPVDHFFLQCMTVKDTGRDVTKGARLTDDLWRAFALNTHWLLDEEFCDTHLRESKQNRRMGGIGAVSNGGRVTGMNNFGAIVQGDEASMHRVGATSSNLGGSLQTLYAIAAGKRG